MKKHLLVVLAILFLSVATLNAQSVHVEATILFDFVVGKTTLHAGKYSLTPTGVGRSTLLLRSSDLKEAILIRPCVCESGAEQRSEHTGIPFIRQAVLLVASVVARLQRGTQVPHFPAEF